MPRATASFVWLGLYEPSDEEFESVKQEFGLHPLAVEDAVNAHQRPKLEVYDDTLLVVLKPVRYIDHDEVVEIGEIALFVNPRVPDLGAARRSQPAEGGARAPRARARARQRGPARGPLRDPRPDRGRLRAGGRGPHDRHPGGRGAGVLARTATTRRSASTTSSARCSTSTARSRRWRLAVERLATRPFNVVDPELRPYFRDVHDHMLRVNAQVEQFRDLLSTALGANLTQINVRQSEDMRRITAWVAIARGADRGGRRSTA